MFSSIGVYLMGFVLFGSSCLLAFPAQVLIIRHGEKPAKGNQLNLDGKARAFALAPFFQEDPSVTELGVVNVIFAQRPQKSTSSIRPVQTVTPLAHEIGLTVKAPYTRDDTQSLANLILGNTLYDGKVVVICWAHQAISTLAAQLGAMNPPVYPEDRFDLVYKLAYDQNGNVSFCVSLQELMFGDLTTLPVGFPACP